MSQTIPSPGQFLFDQNTNRLAVNSLGTWDYSNPLVTNNQVITTTPAQVNDNVNIVSVDPAALLAALAINLPLDPNDGDIVIISFGGHIANGTSVVTALTVTATSPQTIYGTVPTTAAGGAIIRLRYQLSNNKWYNA